MRLAVFKILYKWIDLLFPPACLVCGAFSNSPICHRCSLPVIQAGGRIHDLLGNLDLNQGSAIRNVRSLWEYENNAREFCLAMKNKPSFRLIDIAARILADNIYSVFSKTEWDYIVPVPPSAEGLKKRGFNHVSLLAEKLIRYSRLKESKLLEALVPAKKRKPQASLSRKNRVRGISARFKLLQGSQDKLKGAKVLVIDDILTTGSTVEAAAQALKRFGVSSVDVLTLCHRSRSCSAGLQPGAIWGER